MVLIFDKPVTLAGGGALSRNRLDQALASAPHLVAADGAADRLATWDLLPDAVIGDMDSIADLTVWAGRTNVLPIAEQDSTDFEKCLYATEAPYYIAAGFTGGRVDHMLAVFHGLLAHPEKRIILLGEDDAIAMLPPETPVKIALARGARVSLFPLLPTVATISDGLRWPVDGLHFRPGTQIGTSNTAAAESVTVAVNGPGMLLMLEPRFLDALRIALGMTA